MKKFLHLTKSEFKRIKKSFILTAIILTIFLAALFGVLSVQTDLMRNLCNHLDTLSDELEVWVHNATFNDVASAYDVTIYTSFGDFVRSDIVGADGSKFEMLQIFEEELDNGITILHQYGFAGRVLFINDAINSRLNTYNQRLTGRWMEKDYEICLSRYVFQKLGAQIGDTVTLNNKSFTVVGVYDWEDNDDMSYGLRYAYLLTVSDDVLHDEVMAQFASSVEMFEAVRYFQRHGFEVYFSYDWLYNNVNLVSAVLTAVVVTLSIVILLTLYSLVSMLFRQRKTHICRLKILGASDTTVAVTYCGIVIALLLCVVFVAMALGLVFNYYFMDLCQQIFEFEFTARFNPYAPFISFAAFCAVTCGLWLIVNCKTGALAQEIRYE